MTKRMLLLVFLLTGVMLPAPIRAQTGDPDSVTVTAGGYGFDIHRIWDVEQIDDTSPTNEVFLIFDITLFNRTSTMWCVQEHSFVIDLYGLVDLAPSHLDAAHTTLFPDRNHPGLSDGQCVNPNTTEASFLVYDVPANPGYVTLTFMPENERTEMTLWLKRQADGDYRFGAETGETWYMIGAQQANVRACATPDCPIITTVNYGDSIAVITTEDGWHLARLADGRVGYLAAYLTSQERTTETWYLSGAQAANVRSCPSTECEVLLTVSYGEALSVVTTVEGWHTVELPGAAVGYIAAYLTSQTPPPPPTLPPNGSQRSPYPANTWLDFPNGQVRATRIERPANATVDQFSIINDAPPVGAEYVLIWFEVKCEASLCEAFKDLDIRLIDSNGQAWPESWWLVLNPDLDSMEAVQGYMMEGWQVFEFPIGESIQSIQVQWPKRSASQYVEPPR
jgi:SH3-like domain-containing protein